LKLSSETTLLNGGLNRIILSRALKMLTGFSSLRFFTCTLGAGLGTWGLFLNGLVNPISPLRTAFRLWTGNVVGIFLFTPLILACAQRLTLRISSKKSIEVGIFLTMLISIYFLLKVDYLVPTLVRALPFLVLPFLLWLAFRFDLIVAIAGILITSMISIYVTILGKGPFNLADPYDSLLLLQIFIA